MGNLVVTMVGFSMMKDIEFSDPYNLWALRLLYALSNLFVYGCYYLSYLRVKKENNKEMIEVPDLDKPNT